MIFLNINHSITIHKEEEVVMVIPLTVGFLCSCISGIAVHIVFKDGTLSIATGIIVYGATSMLVMLLRVKDLLGKKS